MICCERCGFDDFFDAKHAAKEMKRYRAKGPMPSTRLLIELLAAEGVDNATLLDIGGGIGVIQHELLDAGAASSLDIDGSQAYIDTARAEAKRRGHEEQSRFELGDFTDVADSVEEVDVVTLDRVICCYHDMPGLVAASAARARRLYGLVLPRRNLVMRIARPVMNTWGWIRRRQLRFYLHHEREVDRVVCEAGMEPFVRRQTFLWQIVVYKRIGESPRQS